MKGLDCHIKKQKPIIIKLYTVGTMVISLDLLEQPPPSVGIVITFICRHNTRYKCISTKERGARGEARNEHLKCTFQRDISLHYFMHRPSGMKLIVLDFTVVH